jgi:hypothetical protein
MDNAVISQAERDEEMLAFDISDEALEREPRALNRKPSQIPCPLKGNHDHRWATRQQC